MLIPLRLLVNMLITLTQCGPAPTSRGTAAAPIVTYDYLFDQDKLIQIQIHAMPRRGSRLGFEAAAPARYAGPWGRGRITAAIVST